MKYFKTIAFIFLLIASSTVFAQDNKDKVHHVAIQLNTADTAAWSSTIGNIRNLQKNWPGKVDIEVVVHGKAINFLVAAKTHLAEDIEAMTKKGVIFNACENTMHKYSIDKAMLLPFAGTVPSGVAELILKQEAGWSYLKAGS
jgi:intracellular sulfur oxidation DsrE/DsrF family protein